LQDEQVERPLQQLNTVLVARVPGHVDNLHPWG
jgi:hypothetical protein